MKYNREKMEATIKAMKRISEIREKRERQFYENRFANGVGTAYQSRIKNKKKQEHFRALKDLEESLHLIEAPLAQKEKQKIKIMEAQKEKNTSTQ